MLSSMTALVWCSFASSLALAAPTTEVDEQSSTRSASSSLATSRPASSSVQESSASSAIGSRPVAPSHSFSRSTGPRPTGVPAKKNPKRGLAFAAADSPVDINNANQTSSVVSWQYNWANIPPAYLATSNIPFIPMQWGSGSIEGFSDAVRSQGADVILGFNEPDFANESNMDPVEAASLWKAHIEPLKERGVRLGAPAVTAAGTGRPWLEKFFEACSDCTFDFLPVHWYGTGSTGFYDFLWSMHQDYPDYPIWVTEYADTSNNDTEVYNFMQETLQYLDELEWIEKYAWFGFFRPEPDTHYNMLREDGGLNALGELYFEAGTVHTHIYSDTRYAGYKTYYGADNAGQGQPTAFPALYGAAPQARNILGAGGLPLVLSVLLVLSGSLMGAF